MVRPEPDQALGKADLRVDPGIEPGLDLFQEILPLDGGGPKDRGRWWRRRRFGLLGLLLPGSVAHAGLPLLLGTLCQDLLGPPCRPRLKGSARGLRAGQQLRIINAPDPRTLDLGEQRPARVGGDGRDRAGTRPEAEAMKRAGGIGFRVLGHGPPPIASPAVRRVSQAAEARGLAGR
jgi:hypothetical protein